MATTVLAYILLVLAIMSSRAMADSAKDREECAEQLAGLTTCLPYLAGQTKNTPSDCCNGLRLALKNNKRCICLILKDRNDPDLSLKINITIALGLPSICKAPDNLSQCPAILHLDPKSPEAQVFNQLGKVSDTVGSVSSSPAPSPTVEESVSNPRRFIPKNAANCFVKKRFVGFEVLVGGILLWYFLILDLNY
ncbi:Lipid transfer protein [Quillaja saponaria]|uniref:Lipid transfer protein n=1 Tax=Quillaja saponaria TaxID=32244 RepID=A0AAD7Q3S3_QUISA|nr:Lipid transfer protein [Quillaja saponaria]